MAQDSLNKQLPVCYGVLVIWGCGRWGRRNVSIEGEISHSLYSGSRNYSERLGLRYAAQWRILVSEEGLVILTQVSSKGAVGYNGVE